jgi:hypothetical protein
MAVSVASNALCCALGRTAGLALANNVADVTAIKAAPVVTSAASAIFSAERVATTSGEITVDIATPAVISWLVV